MTCSEILSEIEKNYKKNSNEVKCFIQSIHAIDFLDSENI